MQLGQYGSIQNTFFRDYGDVKTCTFGIAFDEVRFRSNSLKRRNPNLNTGKSPVDLDVIFANRIRFLAGPVRVWASIKAKTLTERMPIVSHEFAKDCAMGVLQLKRIHQSQRFYNTHILLGRVIESRNNGIKYPLQQILLTA